MLRLLLCGPALVVLGGHVEGGILGRPSIGVHARGLLLCLLLLWLLGLLWRPLPRHLAGGVLLHGRGGLLAHAGGRGRRWVAVVMGFVGLHAVRSVRVLRCLRVVIIVHESVVGRVARVALLGVVRVRRGHSGVVLLAAVAPAGPASALAARRARIFIGRVGRPVVRIGVVVGGHVGHIWGGRVGRQGGRVGSHGAVLRGGVRQTAGQLATNLQRKHAY